MNYWWVNQNQTYKDEINGGFLWSPKTRSDGGRNQFYENMKDVSPGDVIFSFCDTRIKAIGRASGVVQTAPKPDFGNAGINWSKEGWLVPVEFKELTNIIRPKDHIEQLSVYLPEKYSPLQKNGNGLQSVYLAKIGNAMAQQLIGLIGAEYHSTLTALTSTVEIESTSDDVFENAIRGRTDISATTKSQLINSRLGQGLFKTNVRLNEKACRVTGVSDPQHLRASHIKPWRLSDDTEKLHGCNGLLLAPHVDHLFDSGFISFSDIGQLLISSKLNTDVLSAWGISLKKSVGKFNSEQSKFLQFHRTNIFKQ
ncbi:HNH endonuclease [Herminiimonas sp. KBW02]|nr:HNH endonuclease [Herminiimonas sp. KBW02]